MNKIDMTSRDSPTICCLSLKFHILDGNGVRYCSSWSINLLSMNILVLDFVPRDLEWQRNLGPQIAARRDLEYR